MWFRFQQCLIGDGAVSVGQKGGAGKDEHQVAPSVWWYSDICFRLGQLDRAFIVGCAVLFHTMDINGCANSRQPGSRLSGGFYVQVLVEAVGVGLDSGTACEEADYTNPASHDGEPVVTENVLRGMEWIGHFHFVRSGHPTFSPVAQFLTA